MLRRFLTPRWIAAHVFVLVVAGVFIRLGFWQLDRLAERRAHNDKVAERMAMQPGELNSLLERVSSSELEYRQVVVVGTFDADGEILIRSRTHDGEAGFHVVTPLVTEPGVAVLINRGWVPLDLNSPPVSPALPPLEQVQVTGTIRDSQSAPALGPRDPPDGQLKRLYWIDIPRIQQQSDYSLVPVSIELRSQVPAQTGRLPVPVEAQELTEGSHLAYAIQWFAFTVIGLGGYAALLRRSRKIGGVGEPATPG
ncbi:MAG: SURF1 family protein [Acidimicrobiia bacterium]|nr:SURF1 family protein [Acidimicrobiia bacterium]MDH5615929.1 SURF1 family protein [Acidimicrobiia bacterium]